MSTMNSRVFRLSVDRSENGDFIWVITEVGPSSQEIELAASLDTYPTAGQALTAGAKVLDGMGSA